MEKHGKRCGATNIAGKKGSVEFDFHYNKGTLQVQIEAC